MRWRQVLNKETGKSEFIPIDEAARREDGIAIQGDIEPFRSPIDGEIITDRKAYREHMRKHNVVPAQEFSPEFYKAKAEERARELNGQYSREEKLERKREIYEIAQHLERRNGS